MIELRHTDETRAAYDDVYAGGEMPQHWLSYYRWILRQIAPRPGARLLDVCCGNGQLMQVARTAGLDAAGVDFSQVAVGNASAYGPAWVGDGQSLPVPSRAFDYVVNLGSLEHFEDMAAGVREMTRVLKDNGTCCILVPNTFGLLWTITHARKTGEVFDDLVQPLQRYASLEQWRRLLEANGLVVQRVVGYELPPPETFDQVLAYIRRPRLYLLKWLLWPFVPITLASMFVFICKKREVVGSS